MRGSHYNARDGADGRRLSWPWLAVTAAAVALFVSLGLWQLERAEQKRTVLNAAAEQAAEGPLRRAPPGPRLEEGQRFRSVELRGRYDNERQVLLENMTHAGQVGYQVLTPLRLSGGGLILVNRGFTPAPTDRSAPAGLEVSSAERTVRGRLNELPRPGLRLGGNDAGAPEDPWPRRFLYPRAEVLAEALQEPVPGFQVQLADGEPDGFQRDWPTVNMGPERHQGYAVQWFGFAAAAVAIFAILTWRRGTRK